MEDMKDIDSMKKNVDEQMVLSEYSIMASLDADIRDLNTAISRQYTGSNGELYIPGMEGIFTRIINTFYNICQSAYNFYTTTVISFEAFFKNDWVLMCRRWIKLLQDNLPETEAFSGNHCWRGTKQRTEAHIACFEAVIRLLNNLDKEILSKDKSMMTTNIQNVVNYLSTNHCTIDLRAPSKCKAATRYTYADYGRLGTAGYGTEPIIYLNTISRYLDRYTSLYKQLIDTRGVEVAIKRMESEIGKLESQKGNDRQMAIVSEQINNIRARFMVVRGIIRAATDLYHTSLISDFILPLNAMGMMAGWRDDLFTWILAPSDN